MVLLAWLQVQQVEQVEQKLPVPEPIAEPVVPVTPVQLVEGFEALATLLRGQDYSESVADSLIQFGRLLLPSDRVGHSSHLRREWNFVKACVPAPDATNRKLPCAALALDYLVFPKLPG